MHSPFQGKNRPGATSGSLPAAIIASANGNFYVVFESNKQDESNGFRLEFSISKYL